jgi:hypothetical protein
MADPVSMMGVVPVNALAQASLWVGIGALVTCIIGFVTGPIAIALGVMGRMQIAASNGRQRGNDQAMIGIVCGSVSIILFIILAIAYNEGAFR